jgi:hypothetical protein
MGGRLLDWLGAGGSGDLPDPVADMPSRIVPGSTAFYFALDTQHLFVYDESGPTWFDIDMAAITAVSTESIQDMIAAFITNGAGITVTYNDVGNQLVIACTVTQYTDEMAQDAVAALIAAGVDTGLSVAYNDAGNLISITINVAAAADIWGGTIDDKFITPKRLKDWRTPTALVDGATITMDGTTGVNFYVTLGGSRIFANPTNFVPGQFGVIHVTQDGTGSRTLTFGSNFKFGGTSIAGNTLTTTAGATDAIHYYVRADGTLTCFIIQNLTGSPARLKLDDLSNVDMSTPPADTNVLAWNAASSKWKPAAAGGGGGAAALVLLEQHAGAASATLDFTTAFTATYDEYLFEFVNVMPANNNVRPWIRMSTNAGVSYDAGANYTDYYHSRNRFNFSGNGSEVDTQITTMAVDHDNTHSSGINGYMRLFQPLSTTLNKTVMGEFTINNGGGFLENAQFSGVYRSLTAVNAIRFLMSAGNITSGSIRCYGIAK